MIGYLIFVLLSYVMLNILIFSFFHVFIKLLYLNAGGSGAPSGAQLKQNLISWNYVLQIVHFMYQVRCVMDFLKKINLFTEK